MVVAAKQATSEDFKTSQLLAKNLSCTYSAFYSGVLYTTDLGVLSVCVCLCERVSERVCAALYVFQVPGSKVKDTHLNIPNTI